MDNWKRELQRAQFETRLAELRRDQAMAEADMMEAKVREARALIELRQRKQPEEENDSLTEEI